MMAGDPYAGARVVGSAAPTSKEKLSAADLEAKYLQMQRDRQAMLKMQQDMDRDRRTPIPQPPQRRETPGEKARSAYLNEMGTATGKMDYNLPKAESSVRRALREGADLVKHPGFEAAVGLPNPFRGGLGPLGTFPGTSARGFKDRLAQVQGGAFLQAFESLKGAGAITETEGTKATVAMSRMNEASSESDFKSALQDYLNVIAEGYRVAKTQVKRGKAAIEAGGTSTPSREAIQREMQRRGLLKGK